MRLELAGDELRAPPPLIAVGIDDPITIKCPEEVDAALMMKARLLVASGTPFATVTGDITLSTTPPPGVTALGQTETCSKKVRGRARRSLDLIEAMYAAAEKAHPITGRGIGYKLFTAGLIPSMARNEMQRVYRLLKEAREEGTIPWEWIVDETREIERVSTWDDPAEYARAVARVLSPRLLEPAASPSPGLEREGHRARRARAGARGLCRWILCRCMGSAAPLLPMTSPRMTTVAP